MHKKCFAEIPDGIVRTLLGATAILAFAPATVAPPVAIVLYYLYKKVTFVTPVQVIQRHRY